MPTISLCMIAKNEEELIGQCLKSVCDLVDEIVLVDTGSTDRTIEIAKQYGARVYCRPWDNNFSAARNLSLEIASKDWILVLDADEVLDPNVCREIKDLVNREAACYLFTQRHYLNNTQTAGFKACLGKNPEYEKNYFGYFESSVTRLFPNHPKIRFSYPIHELVEPSIHLLNKYNILDHGTLIHHYGHTSEQKKIKDDYKINLYRELGKQKIAADPDSARPYFELGVHLLGSGKPEDFEEAVGYLSKAAQLDAQSSVILMNLGYALMELERYTEAGIVLSRAVAKDPSHVDAWVNLGALFRRVKNLKDAERCFLKAVIFDHEKTRPHALVTLGLVKLESCKFAEAEEVFRQALKLLPKSFEALKGLAICLNQLGRPQSAWEIMQRAANLNLQPLETHYYLGHILRSLGKTTEALEELRLAKEFAISDYADHLNQQLIISKIEKETRELAAEN